MPPFRPECRALLIGSLPLADHNEAFDWIQASTPAIPLWSQLPVFVEERMVRQFSAGMPGLVTEADRLFVDRGSDRFEDELLGFYEDFMACSGGGAEIDGSRFALDRSAAMGFFVFLERMGGVPEAPAAVKGQVTGPITFGTGLHDRDGRAVFYDLHARDAAVKLMAMKARWQAWRLASLGVPVIVFVDEPALAGYGSSELISISREEIVDALGEVIDAIHQEGALAGIHVCANTDWSMVLESGTDIVNFDAYGYFDRFVLYPASIRTFLEGGGTIAWGIVPTGDTDVIDAADEDGLYALWASRVDGLADLGLDRDRLLAQSLITPSCGTGSLDTARARKVLHLTRALSMRAREEAFGPQRTA
jgi:hypothetical protein